MTTKQYPALGAYIFAGGFTRGVLDTGRFNVLGHLEESMYGVRTSRLNLPTIPVTVGVNEWHAERFKRKVAFVYGNPPCAAWSALNGKRTIQAKSWMQDPRVDCTRKHFGLLKDIEPKVWVWESVDRAYTTGHEFLVELTDQALELGYAVTHLRFDAQEVGGLHRRPRYFMIAHKVKFDWLGWVRFKTAPTVAEVLKTVKMKAPGDDRVIMLHKLYLPAYKKSKPGDTMREVWDRIHEGKELKMRTASTGRSFVVGRPSFKNVRLDPDRVSPVIAGTNMIHPFEPRHLNIAEMKAFCGYPRDWILEKGQGHELWNLFTRAVMPPIGAWISGLVARALDDGKKARVEAVTVDLRKKQVGITPFGEQL